MKAGNDEGRATIGKNSSGEAHFEFRVPRLEALGLITRPHQAASLIDGLADRPLGSGGLVEDGRYCKQQADAMIDLKGCDERRR
jgi:hypothetical protein